MSCHFQHVEVPDVQVTLQQLHGSILGTMTKKTIVSLELGAEKVVSWSQTMREHGYGQLRFVVPNHAGILSAICSVETRPTHLDVSHSSHTIQSLLNTRTVRQQ